MSQSVPLSPSLSYIIVTLGLEFAIIFLYLQDISFQFFLLVGHFKNWTGHYLLMDSTLKKITQDVLGRYLVIVSNHNVDIFKIWSDNVR